MLIVWFFIIKLSFRDETNATNITGNNVNASVAISSNHFADTMTTKADPSFTLVSQVYICMLSCLRKKFFVYYTTLVKKDDVK